MAIPAEDLEWEQVDRGSWALLYRGERVGRAWETRLSGGFRAAWRSGNRELGVPDYGEEAANLEEAKTRCQVVVMLKSDPPPLA